MTPTPDRPFRLGTRASPLAVAQAELAKAALIDAHGWDERAVELVPMVASGDRVQDRALAEIGGKALWTRELDAALCDEVTHASVHSLKDVETIRPTMFEIAAILPRGDARDGLLGADSIDALAEGARVGTASPRRAAQLKARRPDLHIELFRGNLGTRLAKLSRGEVDATLLAMAGLTRLGMADRAVPLAIDDWLPAASQGAIAIEVHAEHDDARAAIAKVDHKPSHAAVRAERALLLGLGGDCRSPVAAHARREGGKLRLRAQLFATDGSAMVEGACDIGADEDGEALAASLLARAPASVARLFAG